MKSSFKTLWSWADRLTEVWIEQEERLIAKITYFARDWNTGVILLPEGEYLRLPLSGLASFTVQLSPHTLQVPGRISKLLLPGELEDGFLRIEASLYQHDRLRLGVRPEFLVLETVPDDRVRPGHVKTVEKILELPLRWLEHFRAAALWGLEVEGPGAWDWLASQPEKKPKLARFLIGLLTGKYPPALVCPVDLSDKPAAAALVREVLDLLALKGE